eukprot:COSAG04_NODE_132_length_24268_cov_7.633426_18_plen_245_part_00
MEAAIRRGDITWHANPLNSEDEVYDADTLRAAIDVSHELNARFGRANSLGVGQEDDPGGTRGIIPVLAEKGVKGFYVGYNDGSMNLVPLEGAPKSLQTIVHDNGAHSELFAWRWVDEASGASTIALFHTSGHGGTSSAYPGTVFDSLATNTLVIPGSGIAVAIRGSDDVPPSHGPSQLWCDNAADDPAKCDTIGSNLIGVNHTAPSGGTSIDSVVNDFEMMKSWFPSKAAAPLPDGRVCECCRR